MRHLMKVIIVFSVCIISTGSVSATDIPLRFDSYRDYEGITDAL